MNPRDDLRRENRALRERLALLSQASLSINESLDFDTVLPGVLDSARYGVIALHDENGNAGAVRRPGGFGQRPPPAGSAPGRYHPGGGGCGTAAATRALRLF